MRIIEVVDYKPQWKDKFEAEKKLLAGALGELALAIEHIGSTSVQGLAAKPIVDILLEVNNLEALDALTHKLERLGYRAKGENGIERRRYFQKGGEQRSHHLHAFQSGDPHLLRHLAFRDYLLANPEIALEYAYIKKRAAEACNNDAMLYVQLKNEFIQYHEKYALGV